MTRNSSNESSGLTYEDDPCAILKLYRDELFKATTGKIAIRTRFGSHSGPGRELERAKPNVVELRKEISKLERLCAMKRGEAGAVRAGPYMTPRY